VILSKARNTLKDVINPLATVFFAYNFSFGGSGFCLNGRYLIFFYYLAA
jgi:hypothetical protein